MSAKCAQQSMILTYQIFCVLNPYRGHITFLLPSISKHLENSLYYPHFKNEFVCFCMSLYASVYNNTIVMWSLFIEVIVSFCIKITQGKFM